MIKEDMYSWLEELYPINRSINGIGFDESLDFLISKMQTTPSVRTYSSGSKAGSWVVSQGWAVNAGHIKRLNGETVLDFRDSNLHIWSHSQPISKVLSREELANHLLSLPEQPNAIPYSTTYYEKKWGFSLAHNVLIDMKDENYEVLIDSIFYDHSIKVMDLLIPGHTEQEILFSTYLCHPSMANNELSGPVLMTALINYALKKKRRYSFRFLIGPETIGPIFYLHENLNEIKERTLMGWNLTCVGDSMNWSLLQAKNIDSLPNQIALTLLNSYVKDFKTYDFNERGSDERQYSSPNVNIPMVSVMRSKYHEYPEYHTSLDDLKFVSPQSLFDTYDFYCKLIDFLDLEGNYFSNSIGEPFLNAFFERTKVGGRFAGYAPDFAALVNQFISHSDGSSLHEIANILGISIEIAIDLARSALKLELVQLVSFQKDVN